MDGKIYDLLKKIDDLKIAKFKLNMESRIFLKRLLMDESFLNDFILKIGGSEVFFEKINIIYNNILKIDNEFNDIKSISSNSNDSRFEDIVNVNIFKTLGEIESKKEIVLNEFISSEIEKENVKASEDARNISEQEDIKNILNKLNVN